MGRLIRTARLEANLKQTELASAIYRRQAAVSELENGKMEPTAGTLLLLSYALNKPIHYFFPRQYGIVALKPDDLGDEEQEILLQLRRMLQYSSDKEASLEQMLSIVKAMADFEERRAVAEFRADAAATAE